MHLRTSLPLLATLLAAAGPAAAQPVITGLNRTELPRSGRVAIEGTGFGAGGTVMIGGLEAWTAGWSDTRVVAYVPEASPLGDVMLSLQSGGFSSDEVALTVTLRQPDGRVKWTFETDGDYQYFRPALAPDGTIYLHTNNAYEGHAYALTPNGALKWILHVNWAPYVPPTAGPDGALYLGSINTVYRISPDGEIDWTQSGQTIHASPTAGPDGRIYGAYEVNPGAFALDPATGGYEWTNDPDLSAWGVSPNDTRFGVPGPGEPIDRFYVSWDMVWAFSLDGDYLWANSAANTLSHEPAIGSDGVLYMPGWLENYLVALSPENGSILFQTDSDWLAGISDIEIGPDDTLYFVSDGRFVHAYDPHSQSTIYKHEIETWLGRPSVSPDGAIFVTTGGGYQDVIGFVKAFATNNGQAIFSLDLNETFDPAFRHVPMDHPRISADSTTAYVPSFSAQWPFHDGDPRATLFAIDLTDQNGTPGDTNGDGVVNITDLLAVLGAWGGGGGAADVNGDGIVDILDLLMVLGNWG